MTTKIKGEQLPLSEIFCSRFEYEIPSFQRPYAWTEEEAGDLFDDLYDFYSKEAQGSTEEYFLGSIVLIKEDNVRKAQVIDGQQRLTTLTIVLAAITANLSGENREDLKGYIVEKGRPSQGVKPKPRLHIRDRDNEFFKKYIQSIDFDGLFEQEEDKLDTEAKKNIVKNARLLMDRINDRFDSEEELFNFSSFLVQRCILVVVSTPTQDSAFRIFSVMNSRGLDLLPTDVIKAGFLKAIPEHSQDDYSKKWEDIEISLGRDNFNDLFGHIRMIKARSKKEKALQDEFFEVLFPYTKGRGGNITQKDAEEFIDNTLCVYSEAYNVITNCKYVSSSSEVDAVNEILNWLNRINNSDWVPVAMLFYVKHKDEPQQMHKFLKRLERLAVYMYITSRRDSTRIARYAKVLNEIDNRNVTAQDIDAGKSIDLTRDEIQTFLDTLSLNIYSMVPKKRNYLILRLDSFVADKAAKYNNSLLSIEHILPQTVKKDSQWAEWWPEQSERDKWVHKIANLVPLNKSINSAAKNKPYDEKKKILCEAGNSFVLTNNTMNEYKTWKKEDVENRQNSIIKIYKEKWDLRQEG